MVESVIADAQRESWIDRLAELQARLFRGPINPHDIAEMQILERKLWPERIRGR